MKARKTFIESVSDVDITTLQKIRTVGEVLIFYYYKYGYPVCAWIGVLCEDYLNQYQDTQSIMEINLVRSNTFFLYDDGEFLNVMRNRNHGKMYFMPYPKRCSAQKYIVIPNKKLLVYYNLCVEKFINNRKNKKIC